MVVNSIWMRNINNPKNLSIPFFWVFVWRVTHHLFETKQKHKEYYSFFWGLSSDRWLRGRGSPQLWWRNLSGTFDRRSPRRAREELEGTDGGRESEEPKSATEPCAQSARGSRAVHIACVRPRSPISVITTDYLGPPGTNSATGGLYLTLGPFPVIFGIPPLLDYFHSDRIQFFSALQFSDCVSPVQWGQP